MKTKHVLIFFLALFIIGGAILFIFKDKLIEHYKPDVEQLGTITVNMKNDTSYVTSALVVTNKLFFKIDVDSIKYRVEWFDKIYIKNETFLGLELPANGSDTIPFSIKIPYVAIIHDFRKNKKKADSVDYMVNISLQYATRFWSSEKPINKTGRVRMPHPPEFKLEEVNFTKMGLNSMKAEADLKITNENPVGFLIKDLVYNMKIIGQGNMKGNYGTPITIEPNSVSTVKVPIEIQMERIGKTLMDILKDKDKYNYVLDMNLNLKSTETEDKLFNIDLKKTGIMELRK